MTVIAKWTFLLNVGSTLFMVGLIWFVQIVHYPLFQQVGVEQFSTYEQEHQRLTTFVVMPVMLCEIATAILLLRFRPEALPLGFVWLGISLVAVVWGLTFFVQVPQHTLLSEGYCESVARQLVVGNWSRTWVWTLRGALVIWSTGLLIK